MSTATFWSTNSSTESALLQYCPTANAKCFKYYKTAKNLPSVHTAQENKERYQISPFPIRTLVTDSSPSRPTLIPVSLEKEQVFTGLIQLKR